MEQLPRTAEMPYRIQGLRPDIPTSAVSRTLSKLRLGTESAQPECASHHLGRHYSHGARPYPDQELSHVVKPDKVKWKMLDHSESLKRTASFGTGKSFSAAESTELIYTTYPFGSKHTQHLSRLTRQSCTPLLPHFVVRRWVCLFW